jgi:hypothetical protein
MGLWHLLACSSSILTSCCTNSGKHSKAGAQLAPCKPAEAANLLFEFLELFFNVVVVVCSGLSQA